MTFNCKLISLRADAGPGCWRVSKLIFISEYLRADIELILILASLELSINLCELTLASLKLSVDLRKFALASLKLV